MGIRSSRRFPYGYLVTILNPGATRGAGAPLFAHRCSAQPSYRIEKRRIGTTSDSRRNQLSKHQVYTIMNEQSICRQESRNHHQRIQTIHPHPSENPERRSKPRPRERDPPTTGDRHVRHRNKERNAQTKTSRQTDRHPDRQPGDQDTQRTKVQ